MKLSVISFEISFVLGQGKKNSLKTHFIWFSFFCFKSLVLQ